MSRIAQQRLSPAIGTSSYRGNETPQVPCELDPELWFGDLVEQQAAKRICWADCLPEVRLACLKAAIDENHKWGTWGGMTERDRNGGRPPRVPTSANSIRKDPTPLPGCGTAGGYRNHYKLGQDVCDACLEARREHAAATRLEALARAEPKPAAQPAPCGTTAAYKRHLASKEAACDACRAAKADESRERRAGYRRPPADVVTEIDHLTQQGVDLHRIATTLGVKPDSVITRLRRNGRHDLIERLRNAA